ncbi:hypothetical protein VTN49DRAFT_3472 [Thermomyces lanuginosus]|uniref:uncharacterized protein n=1 Tax=Thermomyces lanuginosus TaxID=5541 RepID=UPI0037449A01
MTHEEKIIANTLDYRKVVNDFMDCLRLPATTPKVVAKGVFPTFGMDIDQCDEELGENSNNANQSDRQKPNSSAHTDY